MCVHTHADFPVISCMTAFIISATCPELFMDGSIGDEKKSEVCVDEGSC